MKEKFTPGPWFHRKHDGSLGSIDAEDGEQVAQAGQVINDLKHVKRRANADLIAASPMLYEALKNIMENLPSRRDWLDPFYEDFAKHALAKALGERD